MSWFLTLPLLVGTTDCGHDSSEGSPLEDASRPPSDAGSTREAARVGDAAPSQTDSGTSASDPESGAFPRDAAGDGAESETVTLLSTCEASLDVPPAPSAAPDRVTTAPDARIRALVSQMTLNEKESQLANSTPAIARIGLPSYQYWNEALHGVVADGTTSFPVPLALGATWDPDLVHEVAEAISDEARALANTRGNALTYFSPTINIVHDPRWGRAEESCGEDPHLLTRMGVAFIEGMQGDDPVYLKTVSTAKHFLANNYENGRTSTSSDVDERTLREFYEPHFKAAVTEAHVYSVMAAYNAVNGVPMVDNPTFLVDLLRGEWGFGGYVVSDCGAVQYSYTDHHYVSSYTAAAALAMGSGTDLECYLDQAVYPTYLTPGDAGVSESRLDEALLRVLRGRFLLGEFDSSGAVPYTGLGASVLDSAEHRALARKAAGESIVLLKNEADLLPLAADVSSVAVVGPYADRVFLGGYSGYPTRVVSVLDGIRARLPSADVITAATSSASDVAAAAARARVAVVVLGTDGAHAAEGMDAPNLDLPDDQESLARAALEANPNTLVVLMAGAPITFPWIRDNVPAILYGWFGGEEGGDAVADVLLGDRNPAGRLPVTLFASTSQLPPITSYGVRGDDGGIGRTYMYFDEQQNGAVLYPFGYGQSYTRFEYTALSVCRIDEKTLAISAHVKNAGKRAGDEVTQVYARDAVTGLVRPRRALKGFRRITLEPGEEKAVTFRISLDDLGYWSTEERRFVVEPGSITLEVGGSSRDLPLSARISTNGQSFLP